MGRAASYVQEMLRVIVLSETLAGCLSFRSNLSNSNMVRRNPGRWVADQRANNFPTGFETCRVHFRFCANTDSISIA